MEESLQRKVDSCAETFADRAAEVDRRAEFPVENFELLYDEGLLELSGGPEFGGRNAGMGGDYGLLFETIEAFGAGCSSTAQCYSTHSIALGTIRVLGSEETHEHFCDEVTENGSVFGYYGSEPAQIFEGNTRIQYDTTATPTGDGWAVNGQKFFTTNSTYADYHMVFAMEEGTEDMSGLLQVVVPDDDPGVTVHDTWDGMGQRATASGVVEFEDAFVPEEYVIGEPGAITEVPFVVDTFQLSFAAVFVGLAQGALDFTRWYLENESKPPSDLPSLAHDPHVQLHVGDMDVRTEAARRLVRHAAETLSRSHDDTDLTEEATMAVKRAKVLASEVVVDVTSRLFQICGARSTSRSFDADRFWRNARTLTLHDILDKQKAEIAQDALGMEVGGRYETPGE